MASHPSRLGFTLPRQTAVIGYDGKRECAYCGAHIDPVDWCPFCQAIGSPCNRPHRRLRKPAHAAFCDGACRNAHRNSAITNHNAIGRGDYSTRSRIGR